ncbi:MAG TPA: PINc/VapC family ATPase [Candidatus Nanoarchaeia archaeon]|nr:PINc/VapC family ATPase [Candidatus Nanoarchaeia archaeon]
MPKSVVEKLVPDTSVIIQGLVSEQLANGELQVGELILHEAVLAELEHQANSGRASGYVGLDEVKRLHELSVKKMLSLRFAGKRPGASEVKFAKLGEIDSLIRQLAWDEDATLLTADKVQARVGEARGIKVIFVPQKEYCPKPLKLEAFFDETTMSAHLRDRVLPMAKKGTPGNWQFVPIKDKLMTADEIKDISREIIEEAGCRTDGFLEIQREGSTIVQLGLYRVVILRPPFSDNWEITAVRPVRKLKLADYEMSEKLRERISKQAEGILIAGAPGMGKSTFAQALAEQYAELGKIVKTVEAPRDLVLPDTITQLSYSRSSPEEVHDVLLLSRPDYSLFDEMRNVPDFLLFTDMRLAGVGMVGVVHGTNSLDAIQRFIGKIDLGVIPHVVDTVVFIKHGKVDQVLSIKMIVKVPAGMTEADLARPTVVISDFETAKPVAEIYSYGEETVVVPVQEEKPRGVRALAAKQVERIFQRYSEDVEVELISDDRAIVYVPEKYIPSIIGREGKNIQALEQQLGIGLDIRALGAQSKAPAGKEIPYRVSGSGKHVEFLLGDQYSGKDVGIYVNNEYLVTVAVGQKGVVRIKKSNEFGKVLINALDHNEKIMFTGA